MTPKRKKAQDYILQYIGEIVSGKENIELYENLFKSMNDKEFDNFMKRLRDGEIHLSIVCPNDGKTRVTVENNLKVAKKLGHEFFQRVKITNHPDYPDHMLPNKVLTMWISIRRAQQLLTKKISIPEHNLVRDQLTGQVAGDSRSAKFSYPEQQIALTHGLEKTAEEFVKIRGGDLGASKAMNDYLFKDGEVSQKQIDVWSTSVRSTKTLKQYFNGMHIKSTL